MSDNSNNEEIISKLKQDLENVNRRIEQTKKKRETTLDELVKIEDEIKISKQNIEQFKQSNNLRSEGDILSKIDSLNNLIEQNKEKLKIKDNKINQLNLEKKEYANLNLGKKNDIQSLTKMYQDLENQVNNLNSQITSVHYENSNLENEIRRFKALCQEEEANFSRITSNFEFKKDELEDKIDEKRDKIKKLEKKIDKY